MMKLIYLRKSTVLCSLLSVGVVSLLVFVSSTPVFFLSAPDYKLNTWKPSSIVDTIYIAKELPDLERKEESAIVMVTGGKQCVPHNHIMFLKTHKCGSSTVQNIFLRYGSNNNLTFALPATGNFLGAIDSFRASMMPPKLLPTDGKVDIFGLHSRLDTQEMMLILHQDSFWVTIVRDPAALYESLFNYYGLAEFYGLFLFEFKSKPLKELERLSRLDDIYGKNQMLFDFGYQDNLTVPEVREAIEELDAIFDLVMIADFMDESLILLRHLLCWSLHDVVAFMKNARRQEVKPPLDDKTAHVLRQLNMADEVLYEYFLQKHHQRVSDFGIERMAGEVEALQSLRNEYFERCIASETSGRDISLQKKFLEYSNQVNSYILANNTDKDCLMLSLPELSLVDYVRDNQLRMLHPELLSRNRKLSNGQMS